MTKRIVLCADDYGQAEAVSSGILALLAAERLSAVSCLVNQPRWQLQAARLAPFKDKADLGLHLNFTDGEALSPVYRKQLGDKFMSLPQLLWRSMTRVPKLHSAALVAEIHAQLDAFHEAMGFLPRFIDGHQHVHHLPVIREALLEVYAERLKGEGAYVRAVTQNWQPAQLLKGDIKSAVIHFTGGLDFAKRLDSVSIPHNTTFAGIYAFSQADHYRQYFQQFLQASDDGGLIMCHPGLTAEDATDPISHARLCEYDYFNSDAFLTDCESFDVSLTKL